ncbi:MAG TPA: alpha-amylase family glycosyl hydrolase [Sphingobacteriaceae bacterium]
MKKLFPFFVAIILLGTACRKDPQHTPPTEPGTTPVETAESGLVTYAPDFPSADEKLTITFDPSKGNKGLANFSGDVYIYTGVITDKSTSGSDWKYVRSSSFNTPDAAAKMTATGSGKYQISFTPRSFYNVPSGEKILKLVMLFKNADGSEVSRNADNSDIFLTIYDTGKLNVRFNSPEFEPLFDPRPAVQIQMVGEELMVSAVSSGTANLTLSLNGTSFASASSTTVSGKAKITSVGNQVIRVTASDGSSISEASFSFPIHGTVQTADLPAGAKDGVTFFNNGKSAIFNLYAPNKQHVYVVGDFNDWQPDAKYFMKRTPDGNRWWVQIDDLDPQKEYAYQYLVDGQIRVADPYTEKVLDPDHDKFISSATYPDLKPYPTGKATGIVSVMSANDAAYAWKTTTFTRPDKKNLVIYELHLRDFVAEHNYAALKGKLDYLSVLGVNAIELMPVQEFEGNSSWGYNPSFYFAPDKYYGTKHALKNFIDECHQRGIAVIMDMVLNHSYGQSPMVQMYFDQAAGKPASDNPWFNQDPTHPFNVGYDFNHEKPATKTFVKNVLEFWIKQYKVDGFRFDLSKGFTQKNSGTSDEATAAWSAYDASRIAIWKEYNSFIKSLDPNFYVILEHFAADDEEKELSAQGMMLWNNLNHNANEGTMGYLQGSDLSRAFYSSHGINEAHNLVTYMESHDEERLMYKNLQFGNTSATYSTKELAVALKRQELAAAFFLTAPGPKMIWQFGELGYDVSINHNGRTGEKPIRWEYRENPQRKALYEVYSKLIRLKKNNPVFTSPDFQYNLSGGVKHIKLMSGTANVVVVGNFDVTAQTANINFPTSGTWTDQLTGQTVKVTGGVYSSTLAPGEYHVYSDVPLK